MNNNILRNPITVALPEEEMNMEIAILEHQAELVRMVKNLHRFRKVYEVNLTIQKEGK